MLQVAVLGPLEVRRDGRLVALPGGKASELLVRLALDAGAVVRADRLIDDVWAAGAVNTRRNTLQSKIAILRRAIGDPSALTSSTGGYALAVEPTDVDALLVLQQAATASRLLAANDYRGAADLCASTLKLYRGDVLLAAGDGDWVTPHKTQLDEARISLVELALSARMQLGDVSDIIGELEAAVATYHYREALWELLITALYQAGRQADALATYKRVKDKLADDLGLDPGVGLRRLEQSILSQDSLLAVPARRAEVSATDRPSGNLPSMVADLVGRHTEITTLVDRLGRDRLVEIVGPGGIGKTAVALATGRTLSTSPELASGGVWLARLETAATADDVVDSVIAALNVPGGEEALFERLRAADSTVVILDNCEHVIDAVADLAVRLLDAAPGLRILCTSQLALGVDGETVFELAPLELVEAVELFVRRASAQRLQLTSGETDDAITDLCRALDGLPLAIELAAARTRTLPVEEISRRLDDRFQLLSDPTSRRPERRRSLKSTIRWSYDLLFPDDQRGLWALATFSAGAPLAAVEFILHALDVPPAAAIDVVGRLTSRSLVIVDDGAGSKTAPDDALPVPRHSVRYRLLDSIRAFALDAMAEAGMSEHAFAAHAAWFADAAESFTAGVRGPRQAEQLNFARAERANIDAALAWSVGHDPLVALRLVNGFGWAWVVLGDSRGAHRILAALAAVGDAGGIRDRAGALLLTAWIEASTGHLELARRHIDEATRLADTINDADLQARSSYYLAYVVSHQGEFPSAMELTDHARALYDGLNRPWDQAASELFAARAAISAGDEQRSIDALDRAQGWLLTVEDPWLNVRYEAMLGELARVQHRFDDAVEHLASAAQTSRRLGFQQTEAYQVSSLGRAQCQAGDYESGAATLELAIEKAEATGDVRLAALARVHWGRVLRATGQLTRARTALEAASAWHLRAGGGEQAALGECLLAAMDAADHVPGADARLVQILAEARGDEAAHVEVFALDALARAVAGTGDLATARGLCAEADQRMEAASHFIAERDRIDARWVRSIA